MGNAQPSDAELLARLRSGDDAACAAFHERHAQPVHLLATTYPQAGPPGELVEAALARLRSADPAGAGPDVPARVGSFVALRGVAAERLAAASEPLGPVPEGLRGEPRDADDPAARAAVLDAFAALPDRLQVVLWQIEVEGRPSRSLSSSLGMTVDATAALAVRARETLRRSYLQARVEASPRPGCEPHRSKLGTSLGEADGGRTATAAHVAGCSSCRTLVAEVAGVGGLLARSIAPWFAPPAGAAGATGRWGRRPQAAFAGARRRGWQAAAAARGDPALTGTVAVAAALVAAVLAAAIFAARPPADVASPAPEPAEGPAPEAAEGESPERDTPSAPKVAERAPAPAAGVPGPPARAPASPTAEAAPATTTAPRPPDDARAAPVPEVVPTTAVPPPGAPPPAPPVERVAAPAPPPADDGAVDVADVPSVPSLSSAVWVPATDQVTITLVNAASSATGILVVRVATDDGALVGGRPTGCALALALLTSGMCALAPLASGSRAMVQVPITVTGPGQSAEVQVCAVELLRLECATPLLPPTVVELA